MPCWATMPPTRMLIDTDDRDAAKADQLDLRDGEVSLNRRGLATAWIVDEFAEKADAAVKFAKRVHDEFAEVCKQEDEDDVEPWPRGRNEVGDHVFFEQGRKFRAHAWSA